MFVNVPGTVHRQSGDGRLKTWSDPKCLYPAGDRVARYATIEWGASETVTVPVRRADSVAKR